MKKLYSNSCNGVCGRDVALCHVFHAAFAVLETLSNSLTHFVLFVF